MRITCKIKIIVLTISIATLLGCGSSAGTNTDNPDSIDTINQKPIAVISPLTEQFIIAGDTVNLIGDSSFDPDANKPLSYEWTFTGAGIANISAANSIEKSSNANLGAIPFFDTGVITVSLVVTDSLGLKSDTTSITVNVDSMNVNRAPNGLISYKVGSGAQSTGNFTVSAGTDVEFFASATDADNDPVTSFGWTFQPGFTAPTTPGKGPFTINFPSAGSYQIILTVTDDTGNTDPTPAQVTVTVVNAPVNFPPNGSISHDNGNGTTGSAGNLNLTTGSNVVFSGNAIDPESDPMTYAWNFPTGVTAPATPGNTPFTANFPTAGIYIITFTVSDSNGNVDPTPAQVTVSVADALMNLPPNGSISHDNGNGAIGSTGNLSITSGSSVVFSGSAVDPESDPMTYAWVFAGATASATTGSGPISVRYSVPGSFIVRLTVSDNNGNSDPTPAELTINVSLPEFKHLPVLNDEDGNPNDATATYTLTIDENINVNVVTPTGSWTTPMMRYNGLQLPPVIVAKRGTQMNFNVQNNLSADTTIHWHGFKIPAAQDGGPDFPIVAAGSRAYNFTLVQPAGPLWFHPHAHGTTATQVYNGLAGAFIVTDDITENLENTKQIPAGDHDIALMIQDRRFAIDNGSGARALIYQTGGMASMAGMLGDRILVNGVELPGLKVDSRQYRFRLYNGSNARTYDVALADGAIFNVVATDGGLLNVPVQTDHIKLGAGERAEIVVDFSAYTAGDNVMLVSRAFNAGGMMGGGILPNGAAFDIMRFDVMTQVTDDVVLYSSLPTNADINTRLTAADATATRGFVMSMGMGPGMGMQFLINGKLFDKNRVDEIVASGATEIWDISNTSAMAHPFHAHAIQWQILDRNGVPATGVDLGWKDTVLVEPNESVRFIGRFDPVVNKGKYMYHCHILEHEEAGMMGIFEVQ